MRALNQGVTMRIGKRQQMVETTISSGTNRVKQTECAPPPRALACPRAAAYWDHQVSPHQLDSEKALQRHQKKQGSQLPLTMFLRSVLQKPVFIHQSPQQC